MKLSAEKFFGMIVLPQYQIISLIITSTLALLLGYRATQEYRMIEPSPQLLPITPKKMQEWGGEPAKVKVGMHIVNFPEFDIINNRIVLDGIVWFEFDPALISLDTIGKFSFEKGKLEKRSEPDTKLIEGKLFAEYKIRLHFTTNLSYKYFPLDAHRIYVALVNSSVFPSEMIFESYKPGFSLSKNIFIAEWTNIDHDVRTGYAEAQLDIHDPRKVVRIPKVVFEIDFRRSGIRQTLLILFPLFLIFFIGLFSFAFDPAKDPSYIITLASGSVTSMIAYRFVIQGMSPESGYFMLSDHVFTLFLLFAFIEFIIAILIIRRGKITRQWAVLRGIIFLLFHLLLVGTWYYLLFGWIR